MLRKEHQLEETKNIYLIYLYMMLLRTMVMEQVLVHIALILLEMLNGHSGQIL